MTQEVQEALARWLADYAGCGSPVEVMAIIRKDAMTLAEAFVEEFSKNFETFESKVE